MFYFAKYIVSVERLNKHEQMDSIKRCSKWNKLETCYENQKIIELVFVRTTF